MRNLVRTVVVVGAIALSSCTSSDVVEMCGDTAGFWTPPSTCGLGTCAVSQQGCRATLACSEGFMATGTVTGQGVNFQNGTDACVLVSTGGTLSGGCSIGGVVCGSPPAMLPAGSPTPDAIQAPVSSAGSGDTDAGLFQDPSAPQEDSSSDSGDDVAPPPPPRPAPAACRSGQRECGTDGECVREALWCDGYPDCSNAADERDCSDEPRSECPRSLIPTVPGWDAPAPATTREELNACLEKCADDFACMEACPGYLEFAECWHAEIYHCTTSMDGPCRARYESLYCCVEAECLDARTEDELVECRTRRCATEESAFYGCVERDDFCQGVAAAPCTSD